MYDENGVWQLQKVYKSKTQTGKVGYFTGRFLVINLSEDDYNKPEQWHVENCKRKRWEYVTK